LIYSFFFFFFFLSFFLSRPCYCAYPPCRMSLTSENQPFLDYPDSLGVKNRRHSRSKLCSQILVSTATSLLWIAVFLFIIPASPANNTCASVDSHGMKASSSNAVDMHNHHHQHEHDDEAATVAISQTHYESGSNSNNITSRAKLIGCGNSVGEARSLGCKYDILLNSWVPEPCYTKQDMMDEYKDDASWDGFRDKELTQKLTVQEMSESEYYFTSIRDHINHCAMIWMKQFWAFYDQSPTMDTMIASPGHTDHCARFLIEIKYDTSNESTKNVVKFAGCWIKEGNMQ
jgi:hypothetical protein